jgi:signal peptidase I
VTARVRRSSPRAWIAAVASLFLPGLGQLIGGCFVRAGVLLSLQFAIDATAIATYMYVPFGIVAFALGGLVFLTWRVWVAVDAYRINRDPAIRQAHGTPAWVAAAGLFAIAVYAVGSATESFRWRVGDEAFRIPAESMAPTLLAGDRVFTFSLGNQPIRRGEIIVFRWPEDTTKSFIKRVVGLPGDTLRMSNGFLEVNGKLQREDYVIRADTANDPAGKEFAWQQAYLTPAGAAASPPSPSRDNWGPLVLPERSFFVLGDNRGESLDSRYWGFVRQHHLVSRPWRIYFSRDPNRGRIRWDRIGRFLHGA